MLWLDQGPYLRPLPHPGRERGGALWFERVLTAKQSCGQEAVNANSYGWSATFGDKKGGW